MYVPSQDSVRVMYMYIRVPTAILLRCMCQTRTVFGLCICVWGFLPLVYWDVCAKPGQCSNHVYVYERSRTVAETLIHIYITRTLSWLGTYILIEKWQKPSYTYTWPEHCPGLQDSVRDMYMCMRVSATIILRCIYQAMTVFGLCICVWGFQPLFY
jgi:hypothetical protein